MLLVIGEFLDSLPWLTNQLINHHLSVLCLARDHASGKNVLPGLPTSKFKVSERKMTMGDIAKLSKEGKLKEMFGAGTAAIVTSIDKWVSGEADHEGTVD